MLAMHSRIQASSGCSWTWLCTNSVHRSGSRPAATSSWAELQGLGPQLGRVLGDGEGVEVDDAEVGVVGVLVVDPVADGPQVVAEVDVTGGLDAGQDSWPWVAMVCGVAAEPGRYSPSRGVRGADRRLRGALRPPAPPDPAGGGRPLRGLPRRIVDAFLAELDSVVAALDLEVATEFLLIAATLVELKARRLLPGRGRRRPRRGAGPVRGARPAARPPARVQDLQGRRRRPGAAGPRRPAGPSPAPPASRSASSPWPPTCWPASRRPTPRRLAAGLGAGTPAAAGRPRPRGAHPGQRGRRGGGAARRAAPAPAS